MRLATLIRVPLGQLVRLTTLGVLWLTLRLTRHARIDSMPGADFGPPGGFAQALPVIRDAIDLIKRHDPRRFDRMLRDVKYVIITRTPSSDAAEYWHAVRACLIDASFIVDQGAAVTALTIAHEATHARLCQAGVGYGEAIRTRVERACVRQEIALAQRLPDSHGLVERLLTKRLDDATWSDAAVRTRARERLVGAGIPRWLLRGPEK